ncbi:MAG: PD-(D/E)XK nuclease family protein [Thermoflexales bacterium]|nr:PD-(D/E)XK nuclease family protein [Thermoflexales bacterium]
MNALTDDIERRIDEFFEQNLAELALEMGHAHSPEVREIARQQVHMYWRKLRHIAERVTDAEVRLTLPQQRTPKRRTFAIEGVVDIVCAEDESSPDGSKVTMYDFKTLEPAVVRAMLDRYEPQLSLYAHIWQNLRGQRLDEAALICTQLPEALRSALRRGDAAAIQQELGRWDPVVQVALNPDHITETIRAFGEVVDQIEDGQFAPPDVRKLRERVPGSNRTFASQICRYCDVRFSCAAYRTYASSTPNRLPKSFFEDYGDDTEQVERIAARLSTE